MRREEGAVVRKCLGVLGALSIALTPAWAESSRLPRKIGACAVTTIKEIGDRSGDPLPENKPDPDTGTLVTFANDGVQVSYQWDGAVAHSRVGDKVRICLVEVPSDCPPNDTRGKVYKTTNLRTNETWTMADSQHMCGGA